MPKLSSYEELFLLKFRNRVRDIVMEFADACRREGFRVLPLENGWIIEHDEYGSLAIGFFSNALSEPVTHIDLTKLIQEMESIVQGELLIAAFHSFASLSAIKIVRNESERVRLYLLSSKEFVGGNGYILDLFHDFLSKKERFKPLDLPEVSDPDALNKLLLAHQYNTLLIRLSRFLFRKLRELRLVYDFDFFAGLLNKLVKYSEERVDEAKMRRLIIRIFEALGFKVEKKRSGAPGHGDVIITSPLRIVIEIKRDRAGESDVYQAKKYEEFYSLEKKFSPLGVKHKWKPILLAPSFTLGARDIAKELGVSLITFKDLFNLFLLLGIYGISNKELLRILHPGECRESIQRMLMNYEKLLADTVLLLTAISDIRMFKDLNQLRKYILQSYSKDVLSEKIFNLITAFLNAPIRVFSESPDGISFNYRAFFHALPRFIDYLIKKVKSRGDVSGRSSI